MSRPKEWPKRQGKFVFKSDVFSLNFFVFILKRQRGRIHCLYLYIDQVYVSRMILLLLFQNIKEL